MGPFAVFRGTLELQASTQQSKRSSTPKLFGLAVVDVQHRAHAVAVFGFPTAGRKLNAVHHIWVGEGEALLLAGTHQKRAVHLDVVDVHQVLVEVAPAHVVLIAELRGDAHAWTNSQQRGDVAPRRRNAPTYAWIQRLHGVSAVRLPGDFGGTYVHSRGKSHIDFLAVGARANHHKGILGNLQVRKGEQNRAGRGDFQFVAARGIGKVEVARGAHLVKHVDCLDHLPVGIAHRSIEGGALCGSTDRKAAGQQAKKDSSQHERAKVQEFSVGSRVGFHSTKPRSAGIIAV